MSLCSGAEPATPRSPRSPRQWSAKNVLDAMTSALCDFLDVHYFHADLTHDDMAANAKAEEMYMDDIQPDGGKGKGKKIDYDSYDYDVTAEARLYAYEHIIRESAIEQFPTHDLAPPAEVTTATPRKHWQHTRATDLHEPVPLPASPTPVKAAAKAKKSAAKKPKKEKAAKAAPSPSKEKAAKVPRAVALNKASTPASAKSPTKAKLAKKASARIAVSVRI